MRTHELVLFEKCPLCSQAKITIEKPRWVLLIDRHSCRDSIFRGCYLDATLPKLEWQKIAQGGELGGFSKFLEVSANSSRGLLPTYPSEGLPSDLEPSEIVHYVSSPVYLGEQKPTKGRTSDKGDFFLTNKRIIFVYSSGTLSITLKNMEKVEDSSPGLPVKEKDSFEPVYFFQPPYDPVFAVLGALHNLKRRS